MRIATNWNLYESIRPSIKTGDVVIFEGFLLVSSFIKAFTKSNFTHVGIVCEMELGNEKNLMLVESSTFVDLPDQKFSKIIRGMQMHWLSKRLDYNPHGDKMWLLPLKTPLSCEEKTKMQIFLRNLHTQEIGYDYLQFMGLGIELITGLNLHMQRDFSNMFCSELVCGALQEVGKVDSGVNPSRQTPENISKFDCFHDLIPI
jgi:hypothetical protein